VNPLDLLRPPYEAIAAAAWIFAALVTVAVGAPYALWVCAVCFTLFMLRTHSFIKIVKFRLSISTSYLLAWSRPELDLIGKMGYEKNAVAIGIGYEWMGKHTALADALNSMEDNGLYWDINRLPKPLYSMFVPNGSVKAEEPRGYPWIAGLDENHIPALLSKATAGGHVIVPGTTGAGKTTLYKFLIPQLCQDPAATVVLIDPKNDKNLKAYMRESAQRAGKRFIALDLANLSDSIRFDPSKNWNTRAEFASRNTQNLASEGGGDSFVQFAWLTTDRIAAGLLYLGKKPSTRLIQQYIQRGVNDLLHGCLEKYLAVLLGANWENLLVPYLQTVKGEVDRLAGMVRCYEAESVKQGKFNEAIDGLMSTYRHDKEHYSKMILNYLPLLQMLASDEMGPIFSPDYDDITDKREIWDSFQVCDQNVALYIGTNSMSNKTVGSAVASMILGDFAATAGYIYNYRTPKPIYMILDESSEMVNNELIQILNKGRGAGFRVFFATQTFADFEARMGNKSKALQLLGNGNSVISFRLKDMTTASWVSDLFDETIVKRINTSVSQGTESEAHALEFRGSISRSEQRERLQRVPPYLLTNLPDCQFFASIGGKKIMGRVPIIN